MDAWCANGIPFYRIEQSLASQKALAKETAPNLESPFHADDKNEIQVALAINRTIQN